MQNILRNWGFFKLSYANNCIWVLKYRGSMESLQDYYKALNCWSAIPIFIWGTTRVLIKTIFPHRNFVDIETFDQRKSTLTPKIV